MFLLDLTHTSHTAARTGIQRVTRSLQAALGEKACAVTWDAYAGHWRTLNDDENTGLREEAITGHRGVHWSWSTRLQGRWHRLTRQPAPVLPAAKGLIVPEIFTASVAAAQPALFATVRGPRVALFHDALALKFPELSPARTVARFPTYLQELLAYDGIAAVSADSRDTLLDYWRWLGVPNPPPVIALPLALGTSADYQPNAEPASGSVPPVVLCVGSLEGRKNHLTLLAAAELLWARGRDFQLHLIGLAHPQTGRAALNRLRDLQTAGRPLHYHGPVDDAALHRAYASCAFTVYPSLGEGFGLPVLESLAHGKPCICSGRGALGESARDGGCLLLDHLDAPAGLAAAIESLLTDAPARSALTTAARARTFRTWPQYAAELTEWMRSLRERTR